MKSKQRKNQKMGEKETVLCWLLIFIILIFVSNIFMHIFVYRDGKDERKYLSVREYSGYEVKEDYYVPVNDDPQIYFQGDGTTEIKGIGIEFSQPVEADTYIEIYYPDAQDTYSEERTVKVTVKAGEDTLYANIATGKYSAMRIDINGRVHIKKVYGSGGQEGIVYQNKTLRHRIWIICLFIAGVLCVCVFKINGLKTKWQKFYEFVRCQIMSVFHAKESVKVLKMFVLGILAGVFLEAIISAVFNRRYNDKETAVLILLIMLVLSFIWFRKFYCKQIEIAFLVIYICCGAVFSYVMPVSLGVCWDDETHYYRMISLARALGGNITQTDRQLITKHVDAIFNQEQYSREKRKENEAEYSEISRHAYLEKPSYSFVYKDIAYLPFIMGVWIAYGLCLSFNLTVVFVRFFNLLIIGILIYLSMRRLKTGKMLVAAFAMIPTVFFLAVSYSYDSWLTFLLLYAFCRYFGELQRKEEPLTLAGFLGIFIPAFLALLPKIVYAPMLFLMAYMPKEKFKEKKWCLAYRACFVFAGLVVVAGILYFASGRFTWGTGDTRGGEEVNADMQIQYILANPGTFFSILKEFLKGYLSYENSGQYLTYMAYMGLVNMPFIPIIILVVTALFDRSSSDTKTVPIISKAGAVLMVIIIAAICAAAMYIAFTPVGLNTVNGCQGRYLLPALFPLLYMVSRFGRFTEFRKKIPIEIVNMAIIFVSAGFLMYNLWVNCVVKY